MPQKKKAEQKMCQAFLKDKLDTEQIDTFWNLLESANKDGITELELYISSPGGDTPAALTIVSMMENCPIAIHTIGMEIVASGAVLVLMAGKTRSMLRHCETFVHAIGVKPGRQTLKSLRSMVQMMEYQEQCIAELYRKYTKIKTHEDFELLINHEKGRYCTPEDFLEWGIIDRIL